MAVRMVVRSLALAALMLAACMVLARATNPGFVARITEKGLDYGRFSVILCLGDKCL